MKLELHIHPIANWLPMIADVAYDQFKEDVRVHGIRRAALVWQEPGRDFVWLLDGRNRQRASIELKIELPLEYWHGNGSVVELIASLNFHRRDLTVKQRALFAARALPLLEEEARKRQQATRAQPGHKVGDVPVSLPESMKGDSRDQAAKLVGVSGKSVSDAKAILRDGIPEVVELVTISLNKSKRIATLPAQEQLKALKKIKAKAKGELAEACVEDTLEAALTRGVAKLKSARKLFDAVEGPNARKVVRALDAALKAAAKMGVLS